MGNSRFMRAAEVAAEMGVCESYAYKVIKRMNEELAEKGCITMRGRVDRKFFIDHFYGAQKEGSE